MTATVGSTRIELLHKDNYDTWCMQAEALLVKFDEWGYVSGTKPKPALKANETEPSAEQKAWIEGDQKARADIILSISPSELQHVRGCTTSREVWLKLQEVYASKGPARKATLLKQLTLSKLSEGDDVREHLMKFFEAVDKLQAMEIAVNNDLLTILLLYSLPASYENFRCAIESRDDLPDPDILRVKILEECESRLNRIDQKTSGVLYANSAKGKHRKSDQRKSESSNKGKQSYFKYNCNKCKKKGHKAADCPERSKQSSVENYFVSCDVDFTVFKAEKLAAASKWCLDSGCTTHLCKDKDEFTEMFSTNRDQVNLANSATSEVSAKGTVSLNTEDRLINMHNVLYVPDLRTNLMSVAKITDKGHEVIFKRGYAVVQNEKGDVIFRAQRNGDLYYVESSSDHCYNASSDEISNLILWHNRLGHLHFRGIQQLKQKGMIAGNVPASPLTSANCEVCLQGKLTALPFKSREEISDEKLKIVHTDVCGPMRVQSKGGAKYFVSFIDDCTRYGFVYFMNKKSEVLNLFKKFKSIVETQTGCKVVYLQSDNGTEYVNNEFDEYLSSQGIQRRLTVAYTPEQNGVAERRNRTLVEMARCMLIQSGLPPTFWAEAVANANYIRNRCPSKSVEGKIPHELWMERRVNFKHIRTFGSKVYILNKSPTKDKFAARGQEGILVGYCEDAKAYRIWLTAEKKVVASRDVKFVNGLNSQGEIIKDVIYKAKDEVYEYSSDFELLERNQSTLIAQNPHEADQVRQEKVSEVSESLSGDPTIAKTSQMKRGPGRPKKLTTGMPGRPGKMYSMVPVLDSSFDNTEDQGASDKNQESSSDSDNDVYQEENEIRQFANIAEIPFDAAVNGPDGSGWKDAVYQEIKSFVKNDVFDIVNKPENRTIVGCRTVLTNKYGPEGQIVKRKARIVAQGFTQKPGVDFKETFAPVARLSSFRLMIALAAHLGLRIHQLDIEAAYLNGVLEEEIFMKQPPLLNEMLERIIQYEDKQSTIYKRAERLLKNSRKPSQVCKLKRALYGLKQAGRKWHETIHRALLNLGLNPTKADPCVYHAKKNGKLVLVLLYVDDFLIASEDEVWVEEIKRGLSKDFKVKDLGLARYCLGFEIHQEKDKITVAQSEYIKELLKRFKMDQANTVCTPLELGNQLIKSKERSADGVKNYPYRELVGGLMYLAIGTRPDITHAISVLSQFNDCFEEMHWKAAKRVLRYLAGTVNVHLVYYRKNAGIQGYVDADWGGCRIDRRSYTGYLFTLSGSAVSWESRKQRTVALSSTESEYMALAEGAKEAIYLRSFMREIGLQQLCEVILYNDNRGAELLAQNPVYHSRSKHIDLRYHFVRQSIEEKQLVVRHVSSDEMCADFLTKALPRAKHLSCVLRVGLCNAN